MDVLVIGGSRFMGPRIIKKLLEREHTLTVFNTGNHPMPFLEQVTFVQGDRNEGFRKIQRPFDFIIDTCAYHRNHVQLALAQLTCTKYILVSTAAVYKKSETIPLKESSSSLGPWPLWGEYNRGKVECEQTLAESGKQYIALRPVYILGQGNHVDRERFIYSKIEKGESLVLPGDGNALVQFVFVQDVANSIVLLAETNSEGAYNCCGDDAITLNELVKAMSLIVGKDAHVTYNPNADGENFDVREFPFANEQLVCSNEKLKTLGVHFTPLIEGLQTDYQFYYQYAL